MPEESHLDEMRDAIRGDFERLAERLGEQELLRVTEPEGAAPEGEDAEAEPEVEPEIELERRSWLARILAP
jgi:hypothetical protein